MVGQEPASCCSRRQTQRIQGSTEYLRFLVPKRIKRVAFGSRNLKYLRPGMMREGDRTSKRIVPTFWLLVQAPRPTHSVADKAPAGLSLRCPYPGRRFGWQRRWFIKLEVWVILGSFGDSGASFQDLVDSPACFHKAPPPKLHYVEYGAIRDFQELLI